MGNGRARVRGGRKGKPLVEKARRSGSGRVRGGCTHRSLELNHRVGVPRIIRELSLGENHLARRGAPRLARSGVERPPMKDARKPSLHDDGLAPPAENFLGSFLHQKPEGLGRHWTRARRGRWSTWTGSRTLPRNQMNPRISAICTRTSEVRVAETAAVIGQRPACVLFTNGESASRRGRRVTRVLAGTLRRVTGLPTRYLNALDFLSPRGRANR